MDVQDNCREHSSLRSQISDDDDDDVDYDYEPVDHRDKTQHTARHEHTHTQR